MKTFTYDDPRLGVISYVDKKRYLWILSVLFPLVPLSSIGLMSWSGMEWTLWVPLLALYAVIPLLDYLFPNDSSNPPEQVVPQLEKDGYYRLLNHLTVPLHFIILVTGAWFVAGHDLGWSGYLAISLTVGVISGFGINTGTRTWGTKRRPLTAWLRNWYWRFLFTDTFRYRTQCRTPCRGSDTGRQRQCAFWRKHLPVCAARDSRWVTPGMAPGKPTSAAPRIQSLELAQ